MREGLTNIARHAHASHVEINVTVEDHTLRLVIKDDGIGIRRERRTGEIGAREHARASGGPGRDALRLRRETFRHRGAFRGPAHRRVDRSTMTTGAVVPALRFVSPARTGTTGIGTLLSSWRTDVGGLVLTAIGAAAIAAYALVLARNRRSKHLGFVPASAAFVVGVLVCLWAFCSGLGSLDDRAPGVVVADHLALITVAPVLLAYGEPARRARVRVSRSSPKHESAARRGDGFPSSSIPPSPSPSFSRSSTSFCFRRCTVGRSPTSTAVTSCAARS